MTAESYYRWCIAHGIPTETEKGVCIAYLDHLKGVAKLEAECRLPTDAKEISKDTWEFKRAARPRALKKYPTYFNDFKNNEKYSGLMVSFRHIKTSPAALFQGETILGPEDDRNTFMYWYIVELNKAAEERKINVPYIRTDDGFIALFKSKRKLG